MNSVLHDCLRDLAREIGNTPMHRITSPLCGRTQSLYLKLEGANPFGSSKDRTALALLNECLADGSLNTESVIVESTSGNLGISLAMMARRMGIRFHAVIDPLITSENRSRLIEAGAELDEVSTADAHGNYLAARLARVSTLCKLNERYIWTKQYESKWVAPMHSLTTATEIFHQMHGNIQIICVPVSTGGTLAGIGRSFRRSSPHTMVIGVDAYGSVAIGGEPHKRIIPGLGASRRSLILESSDFDGYELVHPQEAVFYCHLLRRMEAISVGGSSGAAVAACLNYLAKNSFIRNAVCLCPDSGTAYESTIFNNQWLRHNNLLPYQQ